MQIVIDIAPSDSIGLPVGITTSTSAAERRTNEMLYKLCPI